jgi:SPIRAL1-like protein
VPAPGAPAPGALAHGFGGGEARGRNNNYSRPGGQNVGNFLTDKSSSRVLAPPGGGSSITFG